MRIRSAANRDLPPRMLRRVRKLKSGKSWIGYYYDGKDENGKRREIPLGTDLDEAKAEWARLDRKAVPKSIKLLADVFDRYALEIIPGKSLRTQRDNRAELTQLRKAFDVVPIDLVTPQMVAQYRDKRSAKTRGNREIALLSHVYTIAREWGITSIANPCAMVRRNREVPRDYYAGDDVWKPVYEQAAQDLRDAMDMAYLTGQRPSDAIKVTLGDISEEYLFVGQGKTQKRLRIRLMVDGAATGLGSFIDGLMERRALKGIKNSALITNESGLRMSYPMLRNRWDEARAKAAALADENGDSALAAKIRGFRFADIRPKAASEIEDITHASRLLGHSKESMTKQVYRRVGEIVRPTK
ncbi:tyrosine-type recombinase/integrase [Pseudomonas typographi]|uniref:tyrosine-type recombinase/integrase n=1 Tax=Pseudomonas typographi TaxID=2715964 RepID=UPI001684801A|nr:tyrosine-type recombinase/integrase [Pseudomonas typographi]MBD1554277.1 tyrosine-type recombinase/integrase [Pseudomonas typographi]